MTSHLKILPLLIFVAMLSFSVRLVEIVVGVQNFSGAAYAAKKETAEEKPGMENKKTENLDKTSDMKMAEMSKDKMDKAKTKGKAKKSDTSEKSKDDMDEMKSKWRDASDEDVSDQRVEKEVRDDLVKRRKEIELRERNVATREALLRAAEQELERKFSEMESMRAEIKALLDEQSEAEKKRIQSLVKIYEGMKPKEAARIFDTLDLDVLLSVMSLMSERRLSPILAAMNPERARTVTIMLAEQKSLPELPDAN